MVIPLSSTRQHLGVQPAVNKPSWGYTYQGNIPSVCNVKFKPTSTRMVYPGMPYAGNMFTPWGKPNWSYMPMSGGIPMNIIGGYGGPPFLGPPSGGPCRGGPPG